METVLSVFLEMNPASAPVSQRGFLSTLCCMGETTAGSKSLVDCLCKRLCPSLFPSGSKVEHIFGELFVFYRDF